MRLPSSIPDDIRHGGAIDPLTGQLRHPVDLPASPRATRAPGSAAGLALPHERDESPDAAAVKPDPQMLRAKRDIDAGQVDTDMRATPGLDAALRSRLVPGPAGTPPPPAD